MQEFYIDVELSHGLTRIQVDELSPDQWLTAGAPEFMIEFYTGENYATVTLQLDQGTWYDRGLRFPNAGFEHGCPVHQSQLDEKSLREIGQAIGRHMIVHLTAYMGLFVPVFREPTLN